MTTSAQENVNARNVNALHQMIKENREEISKLKVRVETTGRQNVELQNDINMMRGQIAMLIGRLGGGSTSG